MTPMIDFCPIDAPEVNKADVGALNAFMGGGDLRSPEHAIRLLCTLRSIVAHSGATDFPSACSDCFCNGTVLDACTEYNHMDPEYWRNWRNTGDEVRFIIAATAAALRKGGDR